MWELFGRIRLIIQYNIYWNVWMGLSCSIIVEIVWKDSFNYTIYYLLECLVGFVLLDNSGCEDCLERFV